VRRCDREVKGSRNPTEPVREVHVGGAAAVGSGLGWAWLEEVWLLQFRIGARLLSMSGDHVASTIVSPHSVATRGAFGAVTGFSVKHNVTERAPRVNWVVGKEKAGAKLGGELHGLPSEVEFLGRNRLEEARGTWQHLGEESGLVILPKSVEEGIVLGLVQGLGKGLLPRPLAGGWVDPVGGGQPSVQGVEGGAERGTVGLCLPHEMRVDLTAEAPGGSA